MLLGAVFDRFVEQSPLSVMFRSVLEYAVPARALDDLFERTAQKQYTRELLFSTTVDLLGVVVCRMQPNVKAAYVAKRQQIPVTLKCLYEKLQHIEPTLSAELVRFTAQRCAPLIRQLRGRRQQWLPGYRVKIVDGEHLAATQHRLQETRDSSAAPLPGFGLVLLEPDLMLATDVLLCEDGHAQERSLFGELLECFAENDLCIADRNFCTKEFLAGLQDRTAFFTIRHHANLTLDYQGSWSKEIETERGWVSERPVQVGLDHGSSLSLRCIRVRLKKATRDGDGEIRIVTNLPLRDASAVKVSELYLKRWTLEGLFQELEGCLGCEVDTLCYPKAALFAYCVAILSYNLLSVPKAALRALYGEDKVEQEVSTYYLVLQISTVYAGMMIAIPSQEWKLFQHASSKDMVKLLRELARKIDLLAIKKTPRAPKKPQSKRTHSKKKPHVSSARILADRKASTGRT
jgi:Transposase DDE domain